MLQHDPRTVDNTPGSATCPNWLLLLDDPAPGRVLVLGSIDDPSAAWFRSAGSAVTVDPRGFDGDHPVDLVVLTGAHALGRRGRPNRARQLAKVASETGAKAIVAPWAPTRELRRLLAAHGYPCIRAVEPVARRSASGGLVATRGAQPNGDGALPPRWLAELTAGTMWAPGPGGWTLRVPSAYPSQKAVLHLRPGPGATATGLVKVTRHPRFNRRLDNEFVQLRALADGEQASRRRAPVALARGRVAGCAVVVEEALDGRPFLEVSALDATCPLARDAVRAIAGLTRSGTVPGAALGERLAEIHARFVRDQRPGTEVARFLARQVTTVAEADMPDVVFHGDLGTWNLMVVDGSVRILDWESAEQPGPPFWDLAYFLRSYAVRSGRRRGLKRDRAIRRHLLGTSPLNKAASGWVRDYRRHAGLDRQLLQALFHTCWMHRAVIERSRLTADRPGHYGPLCRHLAENHDAPGLRSLLDR